MPEYFPNIDDYKGLHYSFIRLSQNGQRLTVTLNRPEKRNAFTPLMIHELAYVMQGANSDETTKVVVLQAEGPVFCAGMDLKLFNGEIEEQIPVKFKAEGLTMALALRQLMKPLVAVVEGPVIAGGFLIINECSLVLAEEGVWFRLPEIEIGLFPFQVLERLIEIVGERKALYWCLTGQKIEIEEALSTNLISRIFVKEEKERVLNEILSKMEAAETGILSTAITVTKKIKKIPADDRAAYLKSVLDEFSRKR